MGEPDPSIHQRGSALIHFAYGHLLEVSVGDGRGDQSSLQLQTKKQTTLKAPIDLAQCFSNLSVPQISGGLEKNMYGWATPQSC